MCDGGELSLAEGCELCLTGDELCLSGSELCLTGRSVLGLTRCVSCV